MTTWFTSDLHFGHQLMATLRGFESVEEHDEVLAYHWRRTVKKDDQVWVLGDIAMTRQRHALEIIGDLPGHKHLVAGNHDAVHPMHRRGRKHVREYLEVFESVQPFAKYRLTNGVDVLLSYFPYLADRGPTRYPQWRLPDLGAWLLHGHTHSEEIRTSPREIHVGVDAWDNIPVSADVIAGLME